MNSRKKSGKLLIIATVLTIAALASVLLVFASMLGTFQGNPVTVGGVASGTIEYSTDNSTFALNTAPSTIGSPWYAQIQVSGYSGPVTITWQLQVETAPSTYSDVSGATVTTTTTLTGTPQTLYATADGTQTTNYNFGSNISTGGTYIVKVTVASA